MAAMTNDPLFEGSSAQLSGPWPQLARWVWLVYVVVAGALLPFRVIVTYHDYATVCAAVPCAPYQLDAAGITALAELGLAPQTYAAFGVTQTLVLALFLFSLAGLLMWQRPSENMAVFLAFVFVALGVTFSGNDAWPDFPAWRWPQQFFWFVQTAALVPLFCLFPDGRFPNRWFKWIALASIPPNLISFAPNPPPAGSPVSTLYGLFATASFAIVIVVLVYRYRVIATPVQRQQMKWVLYGTAVNMVTLIVTGLVENWLLPSDSYGSLASFLLALLRFAAIMFNFAGFAIALLHYRLYDVDLLINRTLVYGALSAGATGVYVLMVGGFGALLPADQGQTAAFVLATGLVLLTIRPLHSRLQTMANRLIPLSAAPHTENSAAAEAAFSSPAARRMSLNPLSRLIWLILSVTSLLWFAANVPAFYRQIAAVWGTPGWYAAVTVGLDVLFVGLCTVLGLLIYRHQPDDGMAWLTSLVLIVWGANNGLFIQTKDALLGGLAPGSAYYATESITLLGYLGWMLFFYLFPTGHFVLRWSKITAVAWLLFSGSWYLWPTAPFTPPQWPGWLFGPVVLILWGSFLAAQTIRYRRFSSAAERQQTKWVLYGVAVAVLVAPPVWLFVGTVFNTPLADWPRHLLVQAAGIAGMAAIPGTLGLAVLRRRLWDIDVLVNRTLVYALLTAITVGVYVLVVGGVGSLLQGQASGAVAFLATGLVAVLFQPLRVRLQRAVDRALYGQRDDPVGMLTHLAHRLETVDAPEGILPTLVESIATALKLPYVALWMPDDTGRWQPAAVFGQPVDGRQQLPLLHQNLEVARLFVAPRGPGAPFSREDRRLLATIAQLSATTVQAARLSRELQQSRQQLVTGREEERRRLRRDLHDGLGPMLAAVALQADTARDLAATDPAETSAILQRIMELAQMAVADVRRLVYDLRPPALDELGLVGALRQFGRTVQHQLAVKVSAPEPLPALPAAVEVAAYRIAQEAINNVVRHARADQCTVTIRVAGGLRLVVTDDGVGLPEPVSAGVGLISMQERAAELGGTCSLQRLPARGTRVAVVLPLAPAGTG